MFTITFFPFAVNVDKFDSRTTLYFLLVFGVIQPTKRISVSEHESNTLQCLFTFSKQLLTVPIVVKNEACLCRFMAIISTA